MKVISNIPSNTVVGEIKAQTNTERKRLGILVRQWLGKHLPPKMPFGLPFDTHLKHWEPQADYVISGKETDANATTISLTQHFASNGGHVIWMGTNEDLRRLSEQLMFKIAGLELPAAGSTVQLNPAAQCKLRYAHEQIGKMWIDFCNVEDCGDAGIEQEFLASVASFKPTLIVVDESIFNEKKLNPFEILVRQTHALHMVTELRGTSPLSSVLYNSKHPLGVNSAKLYQLLATK